MKRHLLSQICNEWKSNLWLIIELTIISAILWFVFTFLCAVIHIRMEPRGYDLSDIYIGEIRSIREDSPLYTPYDSVHSYRTDLDQLFAGIRSNPYVELAGSGSNAPPYHYNYYGVSFLIQEPDTIYTYHGNLRRMSPEVMKIYRLEGCNGESSEELASVLERGEIIFSKVEGDYLNSYPSADFFKGKDVMLSSDSSQIYRVGATASTLRRNDYETTYGGVIYAPLGPTDFPSHIIIRIHHGKDKEFTESLTAADKQVGNVYVSGLTPIDRLRDAAQVDTDITIRNLNVCAMFLLLVIFLSFLGTFWFRIQQRSGEISIRKVNGATHINIFRRLISEGLILLIIATILATALELTVTHFGIIDIAEMIGTDNFVMYESMAITFVFMALLTAAGIWMPARKAMKINPAYALKDQ